MTTRRSKFTKKNAKTRKSREKTGKKWITAVDAASRTYAKTGSVMAAKKSLKKQALYNARKLFGSIGKF